MGNAPWGMSVERLDGSGAYTAGKFMWATLKQRARNWSNNGWSVLGQVAVHPRKSYRKFEKILKKLMSYKSPSKFIVYNI